MPEPIKYTCSCCGKVHTQWPALVFESPACYNHLSAEDKQSMGTLNNDFCTIKHPEQTDKFIRCTLTQKVIDHCEDLEYGLWVSLSDKSYEDYTANFKNNNHETIYFGWLSNDLPDYEFIESIPTSVFTKPGTQRPEVVPHESFDHPFVKDYYYGITKEEAEKRIRNMIRAVEERDGNAETKKSWWKFW